LKLILTGFIGKLLYPLHFVLFISWFAKKFSVFNYKGISS
jgi:hypothetical protein